MHRVPAVASLLALSCAAQDDPQQRFDALMAEPFVANAAWVTDFARAKELARESGKPIFAYFTRSFAP